MTEHLAAYRSIIHRQKSVTFEPANVKSSGICNLEAKKSNAKCTKKMYEE